MSCRVALAGRQFPSPSKVSTVPDSILSPASRQLSWSAPASRKCPSPPLSPTISVAFLSPTGRYYFSLMLTPTVPTPSIPRLGCTRWIAPRRLQPITASVAPDRLRFDRMRPSLVPHALHLMGCTASCSNNTGIHSLISHCRVDVNARPQNLCLRQSRGSVRDVAQCVVANQSRPRYG